MPIHVMHVVRPVSGGIREHVRQLAYGLPREQVRNTIVCPVDSPLLAQLPDWLETRILPIQDGIHPITDIRALVKLRKLLTELPADVLHMHGAKAALIGRAAVGTMHHHWRPQLVYTCHNFIEPDNALLRRVLAVAENRLASRTARYIAVSEALNSRLQSEFSLAPHKIVTIYNGVSSNVGEMSRQAVRELIGVPDNADVIGTIARLTSEKGVGDLLHAFRLLRASGLDAWLVIIGTGPEQRKLQAESADLQHRIRWLGAVDQASSLLKGFDVYVQSSRREGFGLAAVEALRAGIPVVAANTGGLPEVMGNGGSQWLVPVMDPPALADKVRQLLTDQAARMHWGLLGQRRAMAVFSTERMIESTLDVYQRVLAESIGGIRA